MEGIQQSLTPNYLPAMEASIPKLCRFCHQTMELKQINLTEAVRQCYKCSTPLKDLDHSDIQFFHRSYKDIHKNPIDWSLNVASEDDELCALQAWVEQVSLTVSKYEDSSDEDIPASGSKTGKKKVQEESVNPSDDFDFLDLFNDLQQTAMGSNTPSEWNNASIDELDAALAKASSQKEDTALPFSFEDFFPPQNADPQVDSIPPKQSAVIEVQEKCQSDLAGERNEVVELSQHKTDEKEELNLDNNLSACLNENNKTEDLNTDPEKDSDLCETLNTKDCLPEDRNICDSQGMVIGIEDKLVDSHGTSEKESVQNEHGVEICEMPGKDGDEECVLVSESLKQETDDNDDCIMIFDDNDDVSETPKNSVEIIEEIENNNEALIENASINTAFHTSTPQRQSKERKYEKLPAITKQSVLVSLNSHDFVLPLETNILSLDNTSIFAAIQTETLVSQFVCDCDEEIVQLSPSSQEKEENHCVDFKLPDLSVSSIMDKEVFDDLQQNISFPSDLDKIIFSPFVTVSNRDTSKSVKKCKGGMNPTKLVLDTSEDASEPPIVDSKQLSSDSILVTIPADPDITPEMLEPTSLDDMPILFESDSSCVLENNANDLLVKDSLNVCPSEPKAPTAVHSEIRVSNMDEPNVPTGVDCEVEAINMENYQTSNHSSEVNIKNDAPVVIHDTHGTCDKVESQVLPVPIQINTLFNAQDITVKSESTEQFSFSYTVCDDSAGGFRIDVNRCDLNSVVSAVPSNSDIFQSNAAGVEFLTHINKTAAEPVKQETENNDCTETGFVKGAVTLNDEACQSSHVPGGLKAKSLNHKVEGRPRKFSQKISKAPLSNKGTEDDDELKAFKGAKFSLLANRKKGPKVEPESKVVNIMQVVKKEVTMFNTKK